MQDDIIKLLPVDTALSHALADYFTRNREFLCEYEPEREDAFYTEEYQRSCLAQASGAAKEKTSYCFYIEPVSEPGKIIGSVALNGVVWGAFCSAYVGVRLDLEYTNRGIMTRAVALLSEYAFETLGLHRLEANIMPRNTASLRVFEKNGFVSEGLARRYLCINGKWEDHIHMVKLAGENRDIWTRLYERAKAEYRPGDVSPFVYAHHVVCALESENGEIFTGFCIESCSGVLTLCAERVAALNMYVNSGQTVIKRIIAFRDAPPGGGESGMPCGACREFLMQLSEKNKLTEIMYDYAKRETVTLGELLPEWWGTGRYL